MMKYLLIPLFVFYFGISYSQSAVIHVVNEHDNSAIPFALVSVGDNNKDKFSHYYCDESGEVDIELKDTSFVLVSIIGFQKDSTFLYPGIKDYYFKLKPDAVSLDEIVVTGQHKPTSIDKSIYNIKLIGIRQIERKAATNLVSLLNNELGIRLSHDPSTGTSMNLQGISGENIKILIDGVPLIGRVSGNIDLSQIDLCNVDHIEIVEGPMSVVYGSNALGGVVNIITRSGASENIHNTLNIYYESVGMYNINDDFTLRKGKYNFGLNIGRNFFDGYDTDLSTRSMEYKPKESYNASIKNNYLLKHGEIKLQNSLFLENLLDRSDISFTPYSAKGYDTWYRTIRSINTLEFKKEFANNSNFSVIADYSYYDRTKLKYLKDLTTLETTLTQGSSDHDTSKIVSYFSRGIYAYEFGARQHSLQVGYDFNIEIGKGKRFIDNTENIQDYALFSDMQLKILKDLIIQPGLRIAYNNRYKSPLIPALNLKYNYKNIAARASYARGFRAPSLKELYLNFYDSNHQIEGNENLKAENSHNYNFSLNWNNDKNKDLKYYFETKLFYNHIFNMITLVQVDPNNELFYRNENIGDFKSKGIEFNFGLRYKVYWNFKAGYGYTGRTNYYNEDVYIYNGNVNTEISYNLIKSGTNFSLFLKHFGKFPYYTYYETLELTYLKSYNNMDITISQNLFNDKVKLIVGAKNLFNVIEISGTTANSSSHGTSDAISSLAGWGRTFFVNVKYRFFK